MNTTVTALAKKSTDSTNKQWTSSAGPRQTKAVNKALSELIWKGRSRVEVHGDGPDDRLVVTSPMSPFSHECREAMDQIGGHFGWAITPANYRDIVAALERATKLLVLPEVDTRPSQEEIRERLAMVAKREKEDAARKAAIEESKARLLPKVPAWADAAIIASLHEDNSDLMSDYHSHKTIRKVLIGFRRGKREDFRQLRETAGRFPETAHMGPGKDTWHVRLLIAETKPNSGYGCVAGNRDTATESYALSELNKRHGAGLDYWPSFETEAEADQFIASLADVLDPGLGVDAAFKAHNTRPEKSSTSIEHRENYSMGAGNYLKAGSRDSNGWCVESVPLSCLKGTAYEDGLPDESPAPAATGGATVTEKSGDGWKIEKRFHTKRQSDFWIVVCDERTSKDEYMRRLSIAKRLGGWYSRAWAGETGGFAFSAESNAQQFVAAAM